MNSQNHSCLLPLMTSDTRNLKERRGFRVEGGGRGGQGGWQGQERDDEN